MKDSSDSPSNSWSSPDKGVLNILMSMLVLSGMAALTSLGLIWFLQSPPKASDSKVSERVPGNLSESIQEPGIMVADSGQILGGIDVESGFVAEGDYLLVKGTCTACHSAKLVLQNRASRAGWKEMIVWMQQTQKLWDLGPQEDKILDYLSTHYGPVENNSRRGNLVVDEWYNLEP